MSQYRADILVSAATLKAARGQYWIRPLGAVPVRGRDVPVEIFALEGMEYPVRAPRGGPEATTPTPP